MSGVYLDTSLLVAGLADEHLGPSARREIAADRGERPLVSDWTISEFASAMGLKVRQRHLSEARAMAAIGFLDAMIGPDLRLVEVNRVHFRMAAALCRHFPTGLRAPDALHLAIGSAHAATVLTLDEQMSRAGKSLGVDVSLIA